jgi:hypothetical protein
MQRPTTRVGVPLRQLRALCISALSVDARGQAPSFQQLAASWFLLPFFFCTPVLCFQSFAASLPETPGVGVPSASAFAAPYLISSRIYRLSPSVLGSALGCSSPKPPTRPRSAQALLANSRWLRNQLGPATRSLPSLEPLVVDADVRRRVQMDPHRPVRKQL